MNTYNALMNNLGELVLNRFRENVDIYLDMIADGRKTTLDALYELSEMEMGFRKEQAVRIHELLLLFEKRTIDLIDYNITASSTIKSSREFSFT